MNKIPVGKTIRSAYAFAFGHLGSIIGLVWAPLVLIAVLQFLPYAMGYDSSAAPESATIAGQRALLGLGTFFLAILLQAMIATAVTQFALGLRPGGAVFHIAAGPAEFRLFGAILLYYVVCFCMGMAFGLLALALIAVAKVPAVASVAFLILVAALCALIYTAVRLGFLIAPVTVAEQHVSLTRGWTLMKGNFWRSFVVILSVVVPYLLIVYAIIVAMVGPSHLFAPFPTNPDAIAQDMEVRFAPLKAHMPLYIGLTLIIAPFGIGLNLGAAAAAYRTLAAEHAREPAS